MEKKKNVKNDKEQKERTQKRTRVSTKKKAGVLKGGHGKKTLVVNSRSGGKRKRGERNGL